MDLSAGTRRQGRLGVRVWTRNGGIWRPEWYRGLQGRVGGSSPFDIQLETCQDWLARQRAMLFTATEPQSCQRCALTHAQTSCAEAVQSARSRGTTPWCLHACMGHAQDRTGPPVHLPEAQVLVWVGERELVWAPSPHPHLSAGPAMRPNNPASPTTPGRSIHRPPRQHIWTACAMLCPSKSKLAFFHLLVPLWPSLPQ